MKHLSFVVRTAAFSVATVSSLLAADTSPATVVKRELDPNGQYFNYEDFEGGWKRIAQDVQAALKDTSLGQKDFVALADVSGLTQIRAVGMSSTSLKDGYDNRIFLHTPGGRKGLLAIFPGDPASFNGARYAPADVDFFMETRLDVPAVVGVVSQIAAGVMESKDSSSLALALLLKTPNSFTSLINFKGSIVALARLHSREESEKLNAQSSAKPPVDVFLRSEGGAGFVKTMLFADEGWKHEDQGGGIRFTKTGDDTDLVVMVDGETVTAGFPRAFVEECLARKDGLAQSADFKQALSETATKGQSLVFATPRAFAELRGAVLCYGHPLGFSYRDLRIVDQLLDAVPIPTKPVASVVVARPDGILIREHSPQSLKVTAPVLTLFTPDFLGQIFRVTARSFAASEAVERAGAVIHDKISADLDKIHAVATKYFAAHADADAICLSELRGAMPDEKMPDLPDVANDISFFRNSDQITIELKIGRDISHVFKLTAEQRRTIENQLKLLFEGSIECLLTGNTSFSSGSLAENGFMPKIEPVAGEDYDNAIANLTLDTPVLTVKTPGEQEVSYTRDPGFVTQARRRQAEQQIAIEHNLARIYAAAQKYFAETPDQSSVSFEQLAQKELLAEVKPVAGEDYAHDLICISKDDTKLTINASRAGAVEWVRPVDAAVQADLIKRLTALEKAVARYFAQNPLAEVVVSGELLPPPPPVVKDPRVNDAEPDTTHNAEPKPPDLTALVIRRDYASIKVMLDNNQVIEVPRTQAK